MKFLLLLFTVLLSANIAVAKDNHTCKRKLLTKIDDLCSTQVPVYDEYRKTMSESRAKAKIRDNIKRSMRRVCARHCGRGTDISCDAFSSTVKRRFVSCDAFQQALQRRLRRVSFYESEQSDDLFFLLIDGQLHEDTEVIDL